jgi:hypothetical protein
MLIRSAIAGLRLDLKNGAIRQRGVVRASCRLAVLRLGGSASAETPLFADNRVDGDVPAEQHAADDLPGVPGRVLRVGGQCQPSLLR